MRGSCTIDRVTIGPGHPLAVIAGPCVLEDTEIEPPHRDNDGRSASGLGLPFVFKASFDKANRSSIGSARGPGAEPGWTRSPRSATARSAGHDGRPRAGPGGGRRRRSWTCSRSRRSCAGRPTSLAACAATGRPVNVKKGQFLSPAEMAPRGAKLRESGCREHHAHRARHVLRLPPPRERLHRPRRSHGARSAGLLRRDALDAAARAAVVERPPAARSGRTCWPGRRSRPAWTRCSSSATPTRPAPCRTRARPSRSTRSARCSRASSRSVTS